MQTKAPPKTNALQVMVIDDDRVNRSLMVAAVEQIGCGVEQAERAELLLQKLPSLPLDVVVMDVNLPGIDGVTAAQKARKQSDVGIILVSVIRDAMTRTQAIDMGADDFMVKPIDPKELASRVRRLGARVRQTRALHPNLNYVGFGIRLDQARQQLQTELDTSIALTPGEHALLRLLVKQPICTHDELIQQLAESIGGETTLGTVKTLIGRLRDKLRQAGAPDDAVTTVRGVGYCLNRD